MVWHYLVRVYACACARVCACVRVCAHVYVRVYVKEKVYWYDSSAIDMHSAFRGFNDSTLASNIPSE